MSTPAPDWETRRFFLPNEDAGVVRAALLAGPSVPARPVFVGGSGMVLLEACAGAPGACPVFVDVAPQQVTYFGQLVEALRRADSPEALRRWFGAVVYPQLVDHLAARGQAYPLEDVLRAAREKFRLRFLFEEEPFDQARAIAGRVTVVEADIVAYLAACPTRHDFIYLGNVPDYLPAPRLRALFGACRRHGAPVYLLLTSACADVTDVRAAWGEEGFLEDPGSIALDLVNRGLGARDLDRAWNRPGKVHLLSLDALAGAQAEQRPPTHYLRFLPP